MGSPASGTPSIDGRGSRVQRYLLSVDRVSMWVGKLFAWLVLAMTLWVTYDVSARYAFKFLPWCLPDPGRYPFCGPTQWAYDYTYMAYGTVFMMGGAYTLSRAAHVRGDIFYKNWPVRVQATVDLVAFVLFFFPAMIALVSVGWQWGLLSYSFNRPEGAGILDLFKYGEKSSLSSQGPAVWPLKIVIPIAGVSMLLQGVVEAIRAAQALRTGEWPQRLSDVEETETRLAKEEQI